jgi:DNA-directed RNA polymerase subunit alpha
MSIISIPQEVKYTKGKNNSGTIEILGCYPNYGATIGNAVRRVLLSSIEGAAITSVKINGATHEFTALDGVLEDVIQIVLNLKQVRFKLHSDEPVKIALKVKGEKTITAGDFKTTADIEIVNEKQEIATITDKKTSLEMEITVEKGIGYVPVDQQENREKDLGLIAIDAVYTPVKRVNYKVENMRVGKRTDYDKVILEIVTDGSIAPDEAFNNAVRILIAQFMFLVGENEVSEEE